jgi:trans-aconitate methyltransferase
MQFYAEYQRKYAGSIRESDRKLIRIIADHVGAARGKTLLDMGCSTGNLLLHLQHAVPHLQLEGADIVASTIAAASADPSLANVRFSVMDMLHMPGDRQYDVVVSNAALCFFTDEEFATALGNLCRAVKPGGLLAVFDFYHAFNETIVVVERSHMHPNGLQTYFRSHDEVRRVLHDAGLLEPNFEAWHMPFDLPRSGDASDMTTYTVTTNEGARLSFRGAVYTPWCHLTARRP